MKRPETGMLAGLWEYPNLLAKPGDDPYQLARSWTRETLGQALEFNFFNVPDPDFYPPALGSGNIGSGVSRHSAPQIPFRKRLVFSREGTKTAAGGICPVIGICCHGKYKNLFSKLTENYKMKTDEKWRIFQPESP